MKTVIAALVTGAIWAGAAQAADFRPGGDPDMSCLMTITGTIQSGDADKMHQALKAVMQNPSPVINGISPDSISNEGKAAFLCLDSPGGSISEALRMGEILYNYDGLYGYSQDGNWIGQLGTAVPADARCESACAVLFLAGGIHSEGDAGRLPLRVLHARGRLGFHSVSLQVPDGSYDAASVNKAFKVALASMEELTARQAVLRLRPSLLSAILTTPPDGMHYVSTVGEAAEWNIDVIGLPRLQNATKKNIAMACNHIQSRHASQDGSTFSGYVTHDSQSGRWLEGYNAIGNMDWAFETFRTSSSGAEFLSLEPLGDGVLCEGNYSTGSMSGVVVTSETLGWSSRFDNHMLFPARVQFSELLALGGPDTILQPDAVIRNRRSVADSRCMVFADGTKLDDDPCQLDRREILSAGLNTDGEILRFTWPSGAVTVVETADLSMSYSEVIQINGSVAYTVHPQNVGLGQAEYSCLRNEATESVFCFQS